MIQIPAFLGVFLIRFGVKLVGEAFLDKATILRLYEQAKKDPDGKLEMATVRALAFALEIELPDDAD